MVAFNAVSVIILGGPGLRVHVHGRHGDRRGRRSNIGYARMRVRKTRKELLDERLAEIVKESVEDVVRRAKETIAACAGRCTTSD